jgi:hypothetical protein
MARPRFVAGIVASVPWFNVDGDVEHEYDTFGNHRITIKGAVGEWADYIEIAKFKLNDRLFAAYTDYWHDMPEIVEYQPVAPRTLADIYRDVPPEPPRGRTDGKRHGER